MSGTTSHRGLHKWVEDWAKVLQPDSIYWCDGTLEEYDRLYVPRNDPRWLRRNALVALGNVGGPEHEPVLERWAAGDDELLAEHARWALEQMESRP